MHVCVIDAEFDGCAIETKNRIIVEQTHTQHLEN